MLVLRPGKGVEVDHRHNPVGRTGGDGPVEMTKTVLFHVEGVGVILEMPVVQRDPNGVEPRLGQEGGVRLPEETGQEPLEKQLISARSQGLQYGGPHERLVSGIARDEVFHVEPAADAYALQPDRLAIDAEHLGPVRP